MLLSNEFLLRVLETDGSSSLDVSHILGGGSLLHLHALVDEEGDSTDDDNGSGDGHGDVELNSVVILTNWRDLLDLDEVGS